MFLKKVDPQIANLIQQEKKRQDETLMMIPSENYASQAVIEALGSPLTNKYSEGYSNARYYQGNNVIDQIETLCIERAKDLFGVPYVNIQPYSGSPANLAVYFALLSPGEKIMGLSLPSGGHLTHGANLSASSIYYKSVQYEVGKDGWLDYDQLERLVIKEKPKLIVAGITHYPRKLNFKRFATIAEKVNAILMADISHVVGLIVAGVYPSPFPYAHVVTTTTHKTLRGPRGAMILVTQKGLKRDPDMGKKINKAIIPGLQGGPHNNVTAALAVSLKEARKKSFATYGKQIVQNAAALADSLKKRGYNLMSGGTDTHVLVLDLRKEGLLGNTAAEALEEAGIVLNRNKVPFDPNPPFYPSGIRMGTPGLTSRGMKEREMIKIASWIDRAIRSIIEVKKQMHITDEEEKKRSHRRSMIQKTPELKRIAKEVKILCKRFPIKKVY